MIMGLMERKVWRGAWFVGVLKGSSREVEVENS
jgi:hypothetical protein